MRVRLAFSVAAHLEPEILLVDEVLAVGDAAFQKKCLGKMGEVAGEGRTVLFVSHQLAMISTLCSRAILLVAGEVFIDSNAEQVVAEYMKSIADSGAVHSSVTFQRDVEKPAQVTQIKIVKDGEKELSLPIDVFDQLNLVIHYCLNTNIEGMAVILSVKRNDEKVFVSFDTDASSYLLQNREPGYYKTVFRMPCPLKAGRYSLTVNLGIPNRGEGIDIHPDIISFDIEEVSIDTSMSSYSLQRPGVFAIHTPWEITRVDNEKLEYSQ
jgi:lipopolysaccharide transport system ATP-binding protein